MHVLLTGAAGFIGSHAAARLLQSGAVVVGVDNLNAYYDPALKRARLERLAADKNFSFRELDLARSGVLRAAFPNAPFTHVLHLAAQAGVRHALDHPFDYEQSNIAGHLEVLEFCRIAPGVRHLAYASSSSVYGERDASGPFRETDRCDTPASLYAATKRACELMSESYARLFGLPQTGLRFFTVYGRWGRPDMAYWRFTQSILQGRPIEIFGDGTQERDFTHIDDIVAILPRLLETPPDGRAPHRLINLGNARPTPLSHLLATIEAAAGAEAIRLYRPPQPGDVQRTYAEVARAGDLYGYAPQRSIEDGIPDFVRWFRDFAAQ